MEDRFTRGLVAGILAGFAPLIFNFGAKMFKISTLVWADFMGLFLLGKKPETTTELAFTISSQFLFLGALGIVFAYLIPLLSSKNYLIKSGIYGLGVWFLTYFIKFIFQLPQIENIPANTAISNAIGGLLWGISLGLILKRLDNRLKIT